MESTSVYWIPIFELLDARGFTVFLVNARDAKHVPGRKTDVSDAQWLQRLHSYGLLRASFRPKGQIAELRAYVRQRERLLEYAASHIQHMQKALTEMNIQLHHVVADITGSTGLRIIRAILAGERDPEVLACLRHYSCHSSAETIAKGLTGSYRTEHLFALEQALALYDAYHEKASALLRLAAVTVGRTDTALGAFYRRLSARIGKAKAVTATARKVAVLFYNAVRHGMEYVDPGASSYETRYRTRVVNNLHRRAKAFGFVLQPLEPKADAVVS